LYHINAQRDFGAAVDACLLVVQVRAGGKYRECNVHANLASSEPASQFGIRDGRMVADLAKYDQGAFLYRDALSGWRSGVKHDCSAVFELVRQEGGVVNGQGEKVVIESDVTYPLLKSSDVARGREPRKWLFLTQRSMTESPVTLEERAPAAWSYLQSHAESLSKRRSSIYRNRPPFSIFGIGSYSLAPWKVAISGLYKDFLFWKIGPYEGRPVLFDDTCYFFPCKSEAECDLLYALVTSRAALDFWGSLVFWDAKRPVTAKLLNVLDF
jgi:hypothetical protein